MTAFEIEQANRSIELAVTAIEPLTERGMSLTVAERIAFAQAHATLAVAWLQLDATRAAAHHRCPSCEHATTLHGDGGCWFTTLTGRPDRDAVCPCALPVHPPAPRESTS